MKLDAAKRAALYGSKFYAGDNGGVAVYPDPADAGSDGLPQITSGPNILNGELDDVNRQVGLPTSYQALPQITPATQADAPTLPTITPGTDTPPATVPAITPAPYGDELASPDDGSGQQLPSIGPAAPVATTPAAAEEDNTPAIAQNPLDAQIASLRQEYGKNFRNTDPNHKHSIWSRIAAATLGWAQGGLLSGIQAARNPHFFEDQKTAENQARVAPQLAALEAERKNEDAHIKVGADITGDIADRNQKVVEDANKAAAAAAKIAADKEYKTNLINLGRERADNIKSYRDAVVELRKQGVAQGDARIIALNKRIEEETRHNKATEQLGGQRIQTTQQQGDLNRQLKIQIHQDVQKNGVNAVRARMQSAFISMYQRANHKMPTQQQIEDHMKTNVEPLLADQ